MRISDKVKRGIAFYSAVILFFITLPILLSYSLGYKIDYKNFKIYKTGIIYLNTHPAGASVYIDDRLYKDLTPTQIEELKPGKYRIAVKLEDYYPWEGELNVMPNMVSKADKIELFPVSKEVRRIGRVGINDFVVSDKGYVYYMTRSGLYRSGTDGSGFIKISSFSSWPRSIIGKKFSPDGNKFLYFDKKSVNIVYLEPEKGGTRDTVLPARVHGVFESRDEIIDVFWYPGAGYMLVVTDEEIKVVELRHKGAPNVATLYAFAKKPQSVYYDSTSDSLYFMDTKAESDLAGGNNLYRIDLKQTFMDMLKEFWMKDRSKDLNEKK